jgi:hypothetical protein
MATSVVWRQAASRAAEATNVSYRRHADQGVTRIHTGASGLETRDRLPERADATADRYLEEVHAVVVPR